MYRKAAEIDSEYAELQFRMARCLSALGDYTGAREAYRRSRDLDTLHFRADTRINDVIRHVAQAGQDAKLVDAEAIFADASPHGIIGNEFLCDHVHFVPEGNYLLARTMFNQITSVVPAEVQAKASPDAPMSEEECERLLALTRYDRARLARENLNRLERPPFTTQINHEEQVLRLAAQASNPETPEQTAQQYQFALQQAPTDTMLHMNFGEFLSKFDREAALNEFRQARPYDDVPFVLPDGSILQ